MNAPHNDSPYAIPVGIVIAGLLISGSFFYSHRDANTGAAREEGGKTTMPIVWGNMGARLVETGAIDAERFAALYENAGAWSDEREALLLAENNTENNGELVMTEENAGYLLNLFWVLGLANKNRILDEGEIADPRYGTPPAAWFASTAGWTMAKGDPMGHYSMHQLITLTERQQALVDKVSRGIYRPCCDNSTHFPDCNHGMAMLGLLELLASQGASESDMWGAALVANSYWFPDTYATIASYMRERGMTREMASPQDILGASYSSGSGFARINAQIRTPQGGSGGGCSV